MSTTLVVECIYAPGSKEAAPGSDNTVEATGLVGSCVVDVPIQATVRHFLRHVVHPSGLCSVPPSAENHFVIVHKQRGQITDVVLQASPGGWASLKPAHVQLCLNPVLCSPMWSPLTVSQFPRCWNHPLLFCVSLATLREVLLQVPKQLVIDGECVSTT